VSTTAGRLARIHRACFTTPRPWSEAEFAGLLGEPGVVLSEVPEGFALARIAGDEAELLTIAVLPASRRRGRARAALQATEAALRARGVARIFLEVAADNAAARALYAACGYETVGRRPGYYRGRAPADDRAQRTAPAGDPARPARPATSATSATSARRAPAGDALILARRLGSPPPP